MSFGISRRTLLGLLPFGLLSQIKKPKPLPTAGEFIRLTDPITENTIVRLTSPASNSIIPRARNRFVSARERILLFSSDRGGRLAPHLIDLRTGIIKQLTDATQLNPRSLCFDKQEKLVRYLDGDSLFEVGLNHGSAKRVAEACTAFANSADGSLFLITAGKLVRKEGGNLIPLADEASDLWPQPNGAGCLFASASKNQDCEWRYVGTQAGAKPRLIARGQIREPFWDVDGQSILFLRDVIAANGTVLTEIHSQPTQGGAETLVSATSQFACFAPNSDASVFVGASRGKAQPNVVLMLRTPHREMTLCEHRASHPAAVSPAFSPDNRRVYFESDREGKSALYSVNVELLVEPES